MQRIAAVILLAIGIVDWGQPARAGDGPIDIGSRRELFVDTFLIDRVDGVELQMHRPIPREVVLIHDAPWEGSGSGYHTIFRDGDRFRMYYKAWQLDVEPGKVIQPHPLFACYAESRDGIHWEKPNLGLFEFNGSKENNIVWSGAGSHDFTPFKDVNPACRPEARYKAVGYGKGGLLAFQSPDGIHWEPMADGKPIMTKAAFDTQNLAFWDEVRGEYRAYVRDFRDGRRDVKTATSNDFLTWTELEWLEYPGAPDEQLYTNQIKPYYRAPHLFIGFPTRYTERRDLESFATLPHDEHRRLRASASRRYGTAVTDGLLMTSRDGRTFHRWGEALLRPGLRTTDNWAYGDNYIAWHVLETQSDIPGAPNELSLYASESYWTGKSSQLRRYTMRIDGFVSVQAPRSGGEFVTKPLIFDGDELALNYSTSAAGNLRIEVQTADGQPIEGFRLDDCRVIFGDELDRIVQWRPESRLGELAGTPIRLRIVMDDADLYSLQFRRHAAGR